MDTVNTALTNLNLRMTDRSRSPAIPYDEFLNIERELEAEVYLKPFIQNSLFNEWDGVISSILFHTLKTDLQLSSFPFFCFVFELFFNQETS